MRKRLSLVVLVVTLIISIMPANVFAMDGAGTVASPFIIMNEADLVSVGNNLSAHYKLGANISLSSSWTAIGTASKPFEGTFDGDGYTITGLRANANGNDVIFGLFGYNKGDVKNVSLALGEAGITVSSVQSAYVGGIAGYNAEGNITNCTVNGNIVITGATISNASSIYAGMIAGKSTGPISYSNTTGTITITNTASAGTYTAAAPVQIYAGGIAGYISGAQNRNFSAVNVDATAKSLNIYSSADIKAGGVAGESLGNITATYSSGNVTAKTDSTLMESSVYAGGLIGKNSGYVEKTYSAGNIAATTKSIAAETYAGGLIGYSTGKINKSYSTANVTSESTSTRDTVYAGGLVGLSGNIISESYAVGLAQVNSGSNLEIVGGLVGYSSVAATNSYYKEESRYVTSDIGGTPKTEEQLKEVSSFEGWDFTDTWRISSKYNSGYPCLIELSNVPVDFSDAEYTYDGTVKTLTATDVGEGVSIKYLGNSAKEAGVYNATATVTASGYNTTVLTAKLIINKKPITISGIKANDKNFDNTTLATIDISEAVIEGIIEGDEVYIDAENTVALFETKTIGENLEVTIDEIVLAGADAANYTAGKYKTTANIFEGDYNDVVFEGNGTESDPYLIRDEAELGAIRGKLDAHYKLSGNITLTREWIPIGRLGNPFEGSFDGNGYTISGLHINPAINYTYSGLFGYNNGDIFDLNVTLGGNICTTADKAYIGAISGYNGGSLRNCSAMGTITTDPTSSFAYVGGLVGNNNGTISFCESGVGIVAKGSVVYAGGAAGENNYLIETTSATGNVSAVDALFAYVGGFVGNNNLTISNCYSRGNATINVSDTGFMLNAGGFAGRVENGQIKNSYSTGKPMVSVGDNAYTYQDATGGFTAFNAGMLTDCLYDSTTSGKSDADKGTPKTTAQMKSSEVINGWDISVWSILAGKNDGYPHILKEYTMSENAVVHFNSADNTVSVKADADIEAACLIVASYSGGTLKDIDIIRPVDIARGDIEIKNVKDGFVIPEVGYVKVMLWENMTTIRPLCSSEKVDIRK